MLRIISGNFAGNSSQSIFTAARRYTIANKDGSGIKAIGVYGDDGKKLYEIHTENHNGISPHYHKWSNGGPLGRGDDYARPLTSDMKKLLKDVQDLKK